MAITPEAFTLTGNIRELAARVRALETRDVAELVARIAVLETTLAAVSTDVSATVNRPLGTTGTMGAFVAGRRVRTKVGFTTKTTDSVGMIRLAIPPGAVCIIAVFCNAFSQGATEVGGFFPRLDYSSITTSIAVQLRNQDDGTFTANADVYTSYSIYYQGAD